MSRPATQHKRATYPVYRPSGIEWLGEIPEHWEVRKFKSCAWFQEGPGLRNWQFTDGGVRVICVTNITESGIDFSIYQKYISEEEYESGYKRFTVQKGDLLLLFTVFPRDVLITTRGTIGRCALLPDDAGKGILHPCLMRVQPDPAIASSEYIALLIQDSGIALLQLQLLSNATTIEVIYSESLKSVRLPLPPVPEQQAILAYVKSEADGHDLSIGKVQDSIDLLREYRTALISAAVTGKIDVRKEVF